MNKLILHTDGVNMFGILAYEADIEANGNYRWHHNVNLRRANKQILHKECVKHIYCISL